MYAIENVLDWFHSSSPSPVVSASSSLVAIIVASWLIMGLITRNTLDVRDKHCYIGGASEGLGFALGCLLAQRGAHVSLVSRSQVKLDKALKELEAHRQSEAQRFAAYSCDLTSSVDSATTLNKACEPFKQAPDFIFACAGGAIPGLFADLEADRHWQCMEWNFRSALNTIHEGVRRMKDEGKQGKIVLTASVLALMGFAGYSSYSPSKYAIRGLADSLRNELQLYGISVHLFLPATIFSPGFAQEQKLKPDITRKIEGADDGMTPEQVAACMIKGLERNDFYMTYEPVGHMLRNSRALTPRNNFLFDAMWGLVGSIAMPAFRVFFADGEVRKEGKRMNAVQ